MCGASAVLGLLMPSVDRVGRYFPLTLAAVFPPGAGVPASDIAGSWLQACETAGRAALDEDVPPDQLARCLPPLGTADATVGPGFGEWWTEGGPLCPDATGIGGAARQARFAMMLGAELGMEPDGTKPDTGLDIEPGDVGEGMSVALHSWAASDSGPARSHNEDAFVDRPDLGRGRLPTGLAGMMPARSRLP